MTHDYITQYLLANSGTMTPRRYHIWCALFTLAVASGRRVFVDHGHFQIRPSLYITLVGRQGIRKSIAKDQARNIITESLPEIPIGASVMSREQIVTRLSHESSLRTYFDETGTELEWRPMVFFVNELKNFMSINISGMVEFLTDIYDTKFFDADTIKHGLQPIVNPCINFLACETPDWIIDKLKMNIIAGGFSRRMLYIYETIRPERITFPIKSPDAYVAESWCKEHLRKVSGVAGPFQWTLGARTKLDKWFRALPIMSDSILEGLYEAKDILVTKVAMLLALAQPIPELLLTETLIDNAIIVLESIEDNLPKLTIAVGRNDLAVVNQRLVTIIEDRDGMMPEKEWRRLASVDMRDNDYITLRRMLQETDQVRLAAVGTTVMVMTLAKYQELKSRGEVT